MWRAADPLETGVHSFHRAPFTKKIVPTKPNYGSEPPSHFLPPAPLWVELLPLILQCPFTPRSQKTPRKGPIFSYSLPKRHSSKKYKKDCISL